MCVIMASETTKPTEDMLRAAEKQNPWGGGVAWREKDKHGKTWVKWEKGIVNVDDVIKLVAKLPPPIVVHFRIPTEGLEDISLTHPFPITRGVELAFSGTTDQSVLFHNGKWDEWRKFSLDTVLKAKVKLPEGQFSDSRMMAWNAFIFGEGILQLINEKAIVFGPERIQIFGVKDKDAWDCKDGVWCSNDKWEHHLPKKVVPITQFKGKPNNQITDPRVDMIGGSGGSRRPNPTFRTDRQLGPSSEVIFEGELEQGKVEGRQETTQSRLEKDRERVVLASGDGWTTLGPRPLIDDPEFLKEYEKLHGNDADWVRALNPKRYRSAVVVM